MKEKLYIQTKEELSLYEDDLANVLAHAFYDDAYYCFIMPNREKRLHQIHWWMKILLRYSLKFGYIQCTDDKKGVALWVGPDRPMVDDLQILLMGMISYPFKVGALNFLRLARISDRWNKEHKKMNKEHYYLMVLGVDPSSQKKGFGSQLMLDGIRKADERSLTCFLETVSESNVKFYQRYGFGTTDYGCFSKSSEYWLMKREV